MSRTSVKKFGYEENCIISSVVFTILFFHIHNFLLVKTLFMQKSQIVQFFLGKLLLFFRLFEPTMKQIRNELAVPMHAMDISDEETFAFMGLVLFDGDNNKVSLETRMQCRYIRNRLFRELMQCCIERGGSHDGPVRFATIVLMITATNRLRSEAKELFHMIKMFDMCDYPKEFDEVFP
jgi:hypothetical protein